MVMLCDPHIAKLSQHPEREENLVDIGDPCIENHFLFSAENEQNKNLVVNHFTIFFSSRL